MRIIRVLCIAPHQELLESVQSVASAFPNMVIETYVGDLDNALTITNAMSYDVIVSRGGTAQLLRKKVNMPVAEIGISVYDVLRVIRLAQQISRPFAIIGFSSITDVARMICNILQYKIPIAEIHSAQEAEQCIAELAKQGTELFLGDTVSVTSADRLGHSSLLITSGPESICNALREAEYLYECCCDARQNSDLFRDALREIPNSLVIFNSIGTMVYTNHAPLDMPFSTFLEVIRKNLPKVQDKGSLDLVKRVGNTRLSIHGSTFLTGNRSFYMFRVSAAYVPQEQPSTAIIQYNDKDIGSATSYNCMYPSALLQTIKEKLSPAIKFPVFIYGEEGSHRSILARYIHLCCFSATSTFTEVNCAQLSEKEWIAATENVNSPLYTAGSTLFFHNVHTLNPSMTKRLRLFMYDTAILNRIHVIFSSSLNISEINRNSNIQSSLLFNLNTLPVYIPPIRERPNDIPAICYVCLSRHNARCSRQLLGFTDEAMETMQRFDWPHNTRQIEAVVQQLATICTEQYVQAQDVRNVLNCISAKGRNQTTFDLSKPLDEIELDVIRYVLADEDMNQTAAAERLGISRSTLWRKLQNKHHSSYVP